MNPADNSDLNFHHMVDREMRSAFGEDLKLAIEEPTRLPEETFVKFFLPMFHGDVPPDFMQWVSIAKSAFMPVHVVDKNNVVLYTVPPFMQDLNIQPNTRSRESFAEMYQHGNEVFRQNFAEGTQIQEIATDTLFRRMNRPEWVNMVAMNAIFKRYDLEEIPLPPEAQKALADNKAVASSIVKAATVDESNTTIDLPD